MKPTDDRLVLVTASLTDTDLNQACRRSWLARSTYHLACIVARETYGVVRAFAQGTRVAAAMGPEVIAALHDDLLIEEEGWDRVVMDWFDTHPACVLAGFGGGTGLGAADIYQVPYDPHQLARVDFVSNLREAEAHGRRVTQPTRVACLDGFSQIGRASFMQRSFQYLQTLGVVHHAYDSHLGVLAAREGGEVWMLPVACHHYGGQTAVGNAEYQAWALTQVPEGDQGFWTQAHEICYRDARGTLPLRF